MPIADLRGVRLHYQLEGADGAPALALAHSLGTDLSLWNPVVARLSSACQILRWDMRGHGESSVIPGPSKLLDFGRDFLALLDTLEIHHCHFAGISLGGMLGLWLAIHAPERLGKLILANTAARIGQPRHWEERIALVRHQGLASVAAGSAERWFTSAWRQAHAEDVTRITQRLASSSSEGYISACAALRDADLTADLYRVQAQTLVVAGAFDPVTTPEDGRTLERSIPRAHYIELAAAHLAPVECPAEFSQAVLAFLAPQEEPRG